MAARAQSTSGSNCRAEPSMLSLGRMFFKGKTTSGDFLIGILSWVFLAFLVFFLFLFPGFFSRSRQNRNLGEKQFLWLYVMFVWLRGVLFWSNGFLSMVCVCVCDLLVLKASGLCGCFVWLFLHLFFKEGITWTFCLYVDCVLCFFDQLDIAFFQDVRWVCLKVVFRLPLYMIGSVYRCS